MSLLLDCLDEIFRHIISYLSEPMKPISFESARDLQDDQETHNPFKNMVENSIPIFLQCRLVSKAFQKKVDQLNPNRFVTLLPALRKKMLDFTDVEAIREPKTSSLFATLFTWVNVQEQRAKVPFMIDKIFKTDADKNIAKNIFNSAVYLRVEDTTQAIGIHIPNNNNSYVVLQCYFGYLDDLSMSGTIAGGIIEYKNKKAPGEIRSNKELLDDFVTNYQEIEETLDLLALNNGRIVNGVLQISKNPINKLVTAFGAPQWSLNHEYGDEYEPHAHEYCFIRFVLSMFGFHKLALAYTNYEIEVHADGSPLFGHNLDISDIIDDLIGEILPGGKTPSLAQLTHELKDMISAHKVSFDSFERATLYYDQLRNSLQAYWLMNIMRIKNKKRVVGAAEELATFVPDFNYEKLADLFEKKIEWFRLERNYAELSKPMRTMFGRWLSFSYSITFNSSQMVIIKLNVFDGLNVYNNLMIRGVGIKSLEKKENETVTLLNFVQYPNKESYPSIYHLDVVEELKTLMEFPENLTHLDVLSFLSDLALQFTKTAPSFYDYLAPRSTEVYFLSVCLDDSDSDVSDYEDQSGDEMEDGDEMDEVEDD